MKKAAAFLGILILAAGALILFYLSPSAESERGLERPATVEPSQSLPELAELSAPIPGADAERESIGSADPEPATTAAAAAVEPPAEDPQFEVVGRIVDTDGRPLSGARIQLIAYNGWTDEQNVGLLEPLGNERSPRRYPGIEAATGKDGRFELAGPLPSVESVRVKVGGNRFYDSAQLFLGGSFNESLPPLKEGRRDLGEIALAQAGAIFGRVVDERGAPIGGVQIWTGPGGGITYSRATVTGDDGRYVLPHARVGTYWVNTVSKPHLVKSAEDITVAAGVDTGPVDFVLEDAPSVKGRLVDADGKGIERARVQGWPAKAGSGRATSAYSEPDGTFTMFLPSDVPYTLQATHPDFLQWGDDGDETRPFAPGTEGLEITMERAEKVRFLVVDDETGEPVESFGFDVHRGEGSEGDSNSYTERRRPRLRDRPGGEHLAAVRAKEDLAMIYAPDYLFFVGDVDPSQESVAAGSPEQVVRLTRGATLVGRFVKDGRPLAGVDAAYVAGNRYGGSFSPDENTLLRTATDADGGFELRGIQSSERNRLTLSPEGGAPTVVTDFSMKVGESTDLGTIEATVGGTITGQLVAPAGIDPAGVLVYLGPWRDEVTQAADSSGNFRFENVPPGEHSLVTDVKPGILASGGSATCVVEAGVTAQVTIDLARQAMVFAEVTLDLGDYSTEGVKVDFVNLSEERRSFSRQPLSLGAANPSGVASGTVQAIGPAGVRIAIPGLGAIQHATFEAQLDYGKEVKETVRFELGSVRLLLPQSAVMTGDGQLRVQLKKPSSSGLGAGTSGQWLRLLFEDNDVAPSAAKFYSLDGGEHVIRGLRAGEFEIEVSFTADGAESVRTELEGGRWRVGPKQDFNFTASVVIRGGEETRVDLRVTETGR